jgi:hypothetical protein
MLWRRFGVRAERRRKEREKITQRCRAAQRGAESLGLYGLTRDELRVEGKSGFLASLGMTHVYDMHEWGAACCAPTMAGAGVLVRAMVGS